MRRGEVNERLNPLYFYQKAMASGTIHKTSALGLLVSEPPCYGLSERAIDPLDKDYVKYLRITDFDDYGIRPDNQFKTVSSYYDKVILKEGDIIFARSGATVGKTYLYEKELGLSVFAGYCIRFRIDPELANIKYIYYYTKTDLYRQWVNTIIRPTGQPNINMEEYKSLPIPLPSYEEQIHLCKIMEDGLSKRSKKLARADEILAGMDKYVLQTLGISPDSKSNTPFAVSRGALEQRIDADYYKASFKSLREKIRTCGHRTEKIKDIYIYMKAGFAAGKQNQVCSDDETGILQIRPYNISPNGELIFEATKHVPRESLNIDDYCTIGEVLFNNTNSAKWVGKSTVFDGQFECTASNHITRIKFNQLVNPNYIASLFNAFRYLSYWDLLSTYFNNQAGINSVTLDNVIIPIPNDDIQQKIADERKRCFNEAFSLRQEAEEEWRAARKQFENKLLGGIQSE